MNQVEKRFWKNKGCLGKILKDWQRNQIFLLLSTSWVQLSVVCCYRLYSCGVDGFVFLCLQVSLTNRPHALLLLQTAKLLEHRCGLERDYHLSTLATILCLVGVSWPSFGFVGQLLKNSVSAWIGLEVQ